MDSQEDDELAEDKEEALCVFQSFLEKYHRKDIELILLAENQSDHYSVNVNALDFFDINMHVGQFLLEKPRVFLQVFDNALCKVESSIMDSQTSQICTMSFKPYVHARFSNLPVCPELNRVNIPKSADVGNFLAISGT